MSAFLPPECLQEIFYFLKDDRRSLHSCLFVNKFWCSCVVPTLWSRPFELARRTSGRLIETYTKFFDEKSKELLSSHHIIIKPTIKPIIFDYPRFIKSIRYHNVYDFSSVWLHEAECRGQQKHSSPFDRTNILREFSKELIKLFLHNYSTVEDLSFNVIRLLDVPDLSGNKLIHGIRPPREPSYVIRVLEYLSPFEEDLLDILKSSKSSLTNLQKLELGANKNYGNIMKMLGNVTKNLQTLEFKFSSELRVNNEKEDLKITVTMQDLIEEQNCLKKVGISQGSHHIPGLIKALKCHVNNLTELSFDKIHFGSIPSAQETFETISSCYQLEKLVITDCKGLTDEVIASFNTAIFRNLKTFIFTRFHNPIDDIFRAFITGIPQAVNANQETMEPLVNLISSTNESLQVLRFGRSSLYGRELPHDFGWGTNFPPERIMDVISLSCPNLTLFEIHIRRNIFPQVLNLLKSTNQLSRFIFSAELDLVDEKDFWRNLSMHIPARLQDLTISIGPVFWLVVLHWLFENVKCNLETLQFPISTFIDDEYLCIIAQYAKRMGTMKRLALSTGTKITPEGLSNALLVIEDITNTGEYNK
ncbi:6778_t:CDS:1 [Funneliformis geosporum]|uniref:2892_t:CDS:1 n=1 Tax=Funneliformis geosporum TaxID=1117311 RepID=A0A9W4WLI3_9GLOM|nr:6778_t:CDS:1 [Funneliformis geosporum]CAI2170942.1 2892_t:CDS:1 [Funneliformis geosporum]